MAKHGIVRFNFNGQNHAKVTNQVQAQVGHINFVAKRIVIYH